MITTKKLTDRIYILKDRFDCCANLVLGSERALLYDTGCGADNMKEAVRKITALPLIVVASHGHFDHTGGSSVFDAVYLSKKDKVIIDEYDEALLNKWLKELKDLDKKAAETDDVPEVSFNGEGWKNIKYITEKEISLGDITGEIVELPGHSLGSVGVFFPELKVLLSGDALEPVMCLMFPNHGDRSMLMETIEKVLKLDFDCYITSHRDDVFNKDLLLRMKSCINNCFDKRFFYYEYPKPPYSKGWFYVDSMDDEPVGIIISDEEYKKRSGE